MSFLILLVGILGRFWGAMVSQMALILQQEGLLYVYKYDNFR